MISCAATASAAFRIHVRQPDHATLPPAMRACERHIFSANLSIFFETAILLRQFNAPQPVPPRFRHVHITFTFGMPLSRHVL